MCDGVGGRLGIGSYAKYEEARECVFLRYKRGCRDLDLYLLRIHELLETY
jgi:hypothetical protein